MKNFPIVNLPHAATPPVKVLAAGQHITGGKLLAVAHKYGMRSMTSVQFKSRWEEAFKCAVLSD
jgi:hypothetical protein